MLISMEGAGGVLPCLFSSVKDQTYEFRAILGSGSDFTAQTSPPILAGKGVASPSLQASCFLVVR